ncbi:MAG: hypothetical protein RBJ76_19740 [Stenomitos frigidus ULC029]
MQARFLAPRGNCSGNLLWNTAQFKEFEDEISYSLNLLREIGYWASAFPEGDGITFNFKDENISKTNEEMLTDFKNCFNWVDIELGKSNDSNIELAELEADRELKCIVIVPLDKIYVQRTLDIGPYTFFCRREFDPEPYERLTDFETEYLQFETCVSYEDVLRINQRLDHNDYFINKCISLAEHALDLVRYVHSSFIRREFTPNPAGQMSNGFYSVEIIPVDETHIKPLSLSGISRPFSVSNNWLDPQVDDFWAEGIDYLSTVYSGNVKNQMASSIIGALRSCRQSFYSLGYESQFLNLVFTLDGLTQPEWTGWKQRTYIAALLCKGCPNRFKSVLKRYDQLYHDVRNKLVHDGMDFYQLTEDPDQVSEEIYNYIKEVVKLVSRELFDNITNMKVYALELLQRQDFRDKYTDVINAASVSRGKNYQIPVW